MRYIDLEGTFNFRDIGGYKTNENRTVSFGKIYRSDALNFLTPEDVKQVEALGIKSIIDYRNEKERVGNEDVEIPGTTVYYLDPKADVAALASSEMNDKGSGGHQFDTLTADFAKTLMTQQNVQFVHNKDSVEAYKAMFDIILDETNIASVQHCRGGKDRTGYGIALILFALGVDKKTIVEDYMLTNFYKKDKNEKSLQELFDKTGDHDKVLAVRYLKEAHESFIMAALNEIDTHFETPLNYLQTVIGLDDEKITKLKDLYLD